MDSAGGTSTFATNEAYESHDLVAFCRVCSRCGFVLVGNGMKSEALLTTFKCDLAFCEEYVVYASETPIQDARDAGWLIGFPIGDEEKDLCPEHKTELEEWLKNEPESNSSDGSVQTDPITS